MLAMHQAYDSDQHKKDLNAFGAAGSVSGISLYCLFS